VSSATWTLQPDDRITLAGPTGCGKSTFARQITGMLADRGHDVVWLDPKRTAALRDLPAVSIADLARPQLGQVRIPVDLGRDSTAREAAEEVLTACFRRGRTIVGIDELSMIATASKIGPALALCYTAGREPGVGVVAVAQRPSRIPIVSLDQAEHLVVWRMRNRKHADLIAENRDVEPDVLWRLMQSCDQHDAVLLSERSSPPNQPVLLRL
jgi:energy-coupling factor transporter ATP-binding protein EcfA2